MIVRIDKRIPRPESYAAARTLGLYNVEPEDAMRFRLDVDVPTERDDWQIGVIVGPSGSGKTSIADALCESQWLNYHPFIGDGPLIEELSNKAGYEKATASLAAVGLGSVPSWLRPYGVLSNGEQFRAGLAGLLLDTSGGDGSVLIQHADVLIDEFTSVLDRQVAKVGAGAFAKAWRKQPHRRIILITPHYDVLEWLQPDWWIDTAHGANEFAEDRGVIVAQEGDFQRDDLGDRGGREIGRIQC